MPIQYMIKTDILLLNVLARKIAKIAMILSKKKEHKNIVTHFIVYFANYN